MVAVFHVIRLGPIWQQVFVCLDFLLQVFVGLIGNCNEQTKATSYNYNIDKSNILLGSCNGSFIELKVQNNQRNKLFERAWPLRLVPPLSAQAQLRMCFLEGKVSFCGIFQNAKNRVYARCSCQLKSTVLHNIDVSLTKRYTYLLFGP